jgi:integrase
VRSLLDALEQDDRALWGTAGYAGLRTGELRALRVSNLHGLDDPDGERWIDVEHGWDPVEGEILPKSKAGVRSALMPETLRAILAEHVARTGQSGDDFLLGTTADAPFSTSYVRKRGRKAWTTAELEPVTLRQLRHAHRSFLDAAGISDARADRYSPERRPTRSRAPRKRCRPNPPSAHLEERLSAPTLAIGNPLPCAISVRCRTSGGRSTSDQAAA